MKIINYLIIACNLLLITNNSAQACMNFIAESEIPKAIAMEPGAGAKRCGGNDPCICFDGIDWETVSYQDVQVPDTDKPIYSKAKNVQACESEVICEALISDSCDSTPERGQRCPPEDVVRYCKDSDDRAYYAQKGDAFEAYCTHVTGYETKIVQKLLEDADKKAEKEARLLARKQEEAQKKALIASHKERLKALAEQEDLTASEIKELVMKLVKMMKAKGEL